MSEGPMMRVIVDGHRCQGIGMCEMVAPNLFEVGDDGLSHVMSDGLTSDQLGAAERAVDSCPTDALSIER